MTSSEAVEPLVLEQVTKNYTVGHEVVVGLAGVDLNVASGEFLAVTGPSGSGKSTLLHCASGLDTVNSGQVFLAGVDITKLTDRELTLTRRSNVGFIFQAYNLISSKTAMENIMYPLRLRREKSDAAWVDEIVGRLGLSGLLDRYPSHMSGGQQQRVAIARSMVSRPQIIFADEPTGALDSTTSQQLLDLFSACTRELGLAIMMVTHDIAAAHRADRIVSMLDGAIEGISVPDLATE